MNTKQLSVFLPALAIALGVGAADSLDNVGSVHLKGYLGERLDTMIRGHVLGTDVDYITACFLEKTETKGWWQTEFWGKYMHSAVPYAVYSGSPALKAAIDHSVERMIGSQEACGYIGNYPDALRCGEGWDVWGMKYTLMGLLHYYDYVQGQVKKEGQGQEAEAKRVIESAKKLCDYVIGEIGPGGKRGRELWTTGNWSGYASSSILEPVMWLYNRTGERKYLDFAAYIVKGMTQKGVGPDLLDKALSGVSVSDRNDPGYKKGGDWAYVCKHGRSKAYEMMSCYQGMLEYYQALKAQGRGAEVEKLYQAALATANDIVKEEINLAGGCACSEAWFHGASKQYLPYMRLQETCVTTTWMRFCEKFLEITDDPKWADQIERTFYNAYLGALKADGREFAGYTPLGGNRWHGQHHCFMHTDCCTANGPRGFLCFLKELCRNDGKVATVNFYASALVKGFDMYSLYPRENYARLVSHTTGPLKLRLRVPAWSEKTAVTVNGKPVADVKPGAYAVIDRTWALGDIVEITFDMPVVAHKQAHHVAFTRGPVLLARDSRFNDGDFNEPYRPGAIKDGEKLAFAPVRTSSDDIWMEFTATLPLGSHNENPEAANLTTVRFCDYASAGNTWHRDNYYRTWFPEEYGPFE